MTRIDTTVKANCSVAIDIFGTWLSLRLIVRRVESKSTKMKVDLERFNELGEALKKLRPSEPATMSSVKVHCDTVGSSGDMPHGVLNSLDVRISRTIVVAFFMFLGCNQIG